MSERVLMWMTYMVLAYWERRYMGESLQKCIVNVIVTGRQVQESMKTQGEW